MTLSGNKLKQSFASRIRTLRLSLPEDSPDSIPTCYSEPSQEIVDNKIEVDFPVKHTRDKMVEEC